MRDWLGLLSGDDLADGDSVQRVVTEITPITLLAAVTGLFAVWTVPPIRLATLEATAGVAPTIAPAALSDSDPRVRRRACELLLESDRASHFYELRAQLFRRPSVAVACLADFGDAEAPETSDPSPEFSTRSEALAYGLSKEWTFALSSEVGSEEGRFAFPPCRAVRALRQLESASGTSASPNLLLVSSLAESERVRSCAAAELGRTWISDSPLEDRPYLRRHFRRNLDKLVGRAFPNPVDATDNSSVSAPTSGLPDGLPVGAYRRWILRRSCRLVTDLDRQFTVLRIYRHLLKSYDRMETDPAPRAFTNPAVWRRACRRFDSVHRDAWESNARDTLVSILYRSARQQAVAAATYRLHVAVRSNQGDVVESSVPRTATAPRRGDTLDPPWLRKRRQMRSVDAPLVGRMVDNLLP